VPLITGERWRITFFGDAATFVSGGAMFFSCQAVDISELPVSSFDGGTASARPTNIIDAQTASTRPTDIIDGGTA